MSNVDDKSKLNLESIVSEASTMRVSINADVSTHVETGDTMVAEFDSRHDTRFSGLDSKTVNVELTDVEFNNL